MLIHNVRLGFATNSSSQHSMIFLDGQKDVGVGDGSYNFDWGYFTAASEDAKGMYFGFLVINTLRSICDEHTARLIASDILGRTVSSEGYIDHQSIYSLPMNWNGKGIDREFVAEFRDFLMRDGLVILGGNDNTEENHPLLSKASGFKLALPIDERSDNLVARKDPTGFWTLFNRKSGAKVRVGFPKRGVKVKGRIAGEVVPTKAYAPELIDIKITDFCPHNCHFCYQGSGPTGQHAEWKSDSYGLLNALKELKVFEVAIGGGEPTTHPKFAQILRDFRSYGIVPSFSTRDLSWLKDPIRWHDILESTGSFAYSIDEPNQSVEEFASVLNAYGFRRELEKLVPQPTVHHVMIGDWDGDFREFLLSANRHGLHVVLLGYKLVGRGQFGKPDKSTDWIDTIVDLYKKNECPRLSVDTTLVKVFGKKLKAAGVPDWLIETQEGKFSMYIDLVESKMGPSSFCPSNELVNLNWKKWSNQVKTEILEAFSSW